MVQTDHFKRCDIFMSTIMLFQNQKHMQLWKHWHFFVTGIKILIFIAFIHNLSLFQAVRYEDILHRYVSINYWKGQTFFSVSELFISVTTRHPILPCPQGSSQRYQTTKSADWCARQHKTGRLWTGQSFWGACKNIHSWGIEILSIKNNLIL